MHKTQKNPLVPAWVRAWYIANFVILVPDAAYILLRPRSLEDGDLGWLFPIFHIYARIDSLFKDKDLVVQCIYVIGLLDIIFMTYLMVCYGRYSRNISYALLVIIRASGLAVKTAVYLMYSYSFIVPRWVIPVMMMNSLWVTVPLLIISNVSRNIVAEFETIQSKGE